MHHDAPRYSVQAIHSACPTKGRIGTCFAVVILLWSATCHGVEAPLVACLTDGTIEIRNPTTQDFASPGIDFQSPLGGLTVVDATPYSIVYLDTPTDVVLGNISESYTFAAGANVKTGVQFLGTQAESEQVQVTFDSSFDPKLLGAGCQPMPAPIFGSVTGQTLDFGRVAQGDQPAGLLRDVLNIHARLEPVALTAVGFTGSVEDAFRVPDFAPTTLAPNQFATFDVAVNVDLPVGVYEATLFVVEEQANEVLTVRAEIMPSGDCNADGQLNADDLPCVASIWERDRVLNALGTVPGDLNGDRNVDFFDFITLSRNYRSNLPAYTDGNVNLAGSIGFVDFLDMARNFGPVAVASVPEPGCSLAYLLPLFLGCGRRRRK